MHSRERSYVVSLYLLYGLYYMMMAASSYQAVYFKDIGMNNTEIGTIQSVAPLIAMFFQPFWGMLGDRMRYKRVLLSILVGALGAISLLLRVSVAFGVVLALFTLLSIVQSPCTAIMDTITLEYTEQVRQPFGPIRMMGSIGYVLAAWLSGIYMQNDTGRVFYLMSAIAFTLFGLSFFLPPVQGHQTREKRVPIRVLFTNKNLLLLFAMIFVSTITTTYGYSFFSKYFSQLGAPNSMVGAMLFVGSFLEIPFLLFADKIMPKLSIWAWVLLGMLITAVRWVLIGFTTNLYALMALQMPNVFATICFTYGPVLYVNKHTPLELRATAQTTMVFVSFGISRVVGSFLGGYFSDLYSIPAVFTFNGIFLFICLATFTAYIARTKGWAAITQPGDL